MPKLHEMLAVEKGEKQQATKKLTKLHRAAELEKLYEGHTRTYRPADELGEKLPDESQIVQLKAEAVLEAEAEILAPLWDLVATKDWANAGPAKADVVVDGNILIAGAPVSFLLWAVKKLEDIETFLSKMPVLDPSEKWAWDPDQNCHSTGDQWSNRTKKVLRNHTKFGGDANHPPQVEMYNEDVVIGTFHRIRYSGALGAETREKLLRRVRDLKNAIGTARERANSVEVEKQELGKKVFGFLLEPLQQ